ncbi:hypothetical protein BGZ96_005826 [Linnemannia gamsii]|uniref:RING-type domain-containing protein n=1 Tax=Linnemannia gamsii TaxID=64522 RepID=A0ABQ7K3F6_9FUNG|nr:hypothetical protein BGZ96_005826 [Linnemannia gamsii]
MADSRTANFSNTTTKGDDKDDRNDDTSNTDPICAICLASYTGRVYLSPCMHSFCASCFSAWVDVSVLCPLCKSKPEEIHWGVDTALGVLNTITVTSFSPLYADRRRFQRETGELTWREALKNVARQARKDDEEKEQLAQASADEHDTQENGDALDDTSGSTGGNPESQDDEERESVEDQRLAASSSRKRSRSRSRSGSRSRSRSKSITPIDSHPYDSDALFFSSATLLARGDPLHDHESAYDNAPNISERDSATERTPSRQEVYALGMEPSPEQDFPLSDEVRSIDMAFLTPFLQQDLAVLTNSRDRAVAPVILDLIRSLFVRHGSNTSAASSSQGGKGHIHKRQALDIKDKKQQDEKVKEPIEWSVIEQEVAQWIALTPSKDNWRELDMARLFVREMRRAVKKRWTVKRWNNSVLYQPIPASSSASPTSSV